MLLSKQKHKQKRALTLLRELHQLWLARRSLPSVPLEEPIQRGYKRSYKFKSGILPYRSDAQALIAILNRINVTNYSPDGSFKEKRHWKSKMWVDIKQQPRPIYEHRWPFPKEYKEKYFDASYPGKFCWKCFEFSKHMHYHFRFEHYLEFNVEPNMLTHYTDADPYIETRIKEIENKMEAEQLWSIINRAKGSHHRDRDLKRKYPVRDQRRKESVDEQIHEPDDV